MTTTNPKRGPRNLWWVRGGILALAAAAAGAAVYVLATVPPTDDALYPRCQLHSLTGLHCPGCGTTRALHALLNGRVAEAFGYNALFPVVLPAVAWAFYSSVQASRGRAAAPGRAGAWGLRLLAAAVILYGVLRNVPAYPFTLLAPGGA